MTFRDVQLQPWMIVAWPLSFFLVVCLLGTLLSRWLGNRKPAVGPTKPPPTNRGCLIAFGGLFAMAGVFAMFMMTIRPIYRAYQASAWPTVPGQVISSRLAESTSEDGTSYRIDIQYRYTVKGRPCESNQYDGNGTHISSGFRTAKLAVVRAHPPGTAVTVHYNPADPDDAMLSTTIPHGTIAFIWFPFIFIGAGVAIMVFSNRIRPAGTPVAAKAVPLARSAADARSSRRRGFLVILIFAIFWNGVIGTVFLTGGASWCLLPFALVGLVMIVFAGYSGLQLFNPVVAVQFAHMPIRPGERCEVTYTLSGNFLALRNLSFNLEGREKVTYRQGTNTRSETHVAWRIPLLENTRNSEYERGKFAITLPADVMTSFVAPNNQFTWHLCCRGDIPGRPNIKDDFDVTVLAKGAT